MDGDGDVFVVAYERSEATSGTGNDDIGVSSLIWSPTSGQLENLVSDVVLGSTPNDDENDPAVAYLNGEVLVVFEDVNPLASTDYDVRYFAVDPFTCLSCETVNSALASGSAAKQRFPAVASQVSGGDIGNEALVVFNSEASGVTNNGDLLGRIFTPQDGNLTSLGGACGNAGQLEVGCARSPNPNGRIFLTGATPGAAAWIVLSREARNMSCTGCRLAPDPYTGWIASTTVAANGTASFAVNIPSSVAGLQVYAQWLVFDATPACSMFGMDLTSGYRITLQ